MANGHRLVTLPSHVDERGTLVVIDDTVTPDFEVRRAYVIRGVPGTEVRGAHAHRELRQIVVPLAGSFTVSVDDGEQTAEYLLADSGVGLFLGRMVWRELRAFSEDAVALVLASDRYNPDDYINDLSQFHDEYAAQIVTMAFL
jgi:dTDP-4-dehydrorhamnose 3,5-epimerase-like enzyme